MKVPCLVETLDHDYQFAKAEAGQMCWICRNCGDVAIEYEDSRP